MFQLNEMYTLTLPCWVFVYNHFFFIFIVHFSLEEIRGKYSTDEEKQDALISLVIINGWIFTNKWEENFEFIWKDCKGIAFL